MRSASLFFVAAAFASTSPVFAQSGAPTDQCTGPSASDVGTCRPRSGGGTVSIVIEREIVWVPGPPVIIWKRPSAVGSGQTDFRAVENPAMQRALNDWSQTSWTLYRKGKAELAKGNYIAAETYFNAALNKHPAVNEIDDIQEALDVARRRHQFDNARGSAGDEVKINKFSKTEIREIKSTDLPPQLFDANRTDLDRLRKELGHLLLKRYKAEEELRRLPKSGTKGVSGSRRRIEAALDEAKAAVSKKINENKDLITRVVLDQ